MTLFLIFIALVITAVIFVIIKIISNRVNGREELEGLFVFKNKNKH